MNIVVLSGRLVADPSCRLDPAGHATWSLDVATPLDPELVASSGAGTGRVSVPVAWRRDTLPGSWTADTEVVVAGVVRRRFFRAGGSTQSRTEVLAVDVVEVTRRRPLARAIERAVASLGAADRSTLRSATG